MIRETLDAPARFSSIISSVNPRHFYVMRCCGLWATVHTRTTIGGQTTPLLGQGGAGGTNRVDNIALPTTLRIIKQGVNFYGQVFQSNSWVPVQNLCIYSHLRYGMARYQTFLQLSTMGLQRACIQMIMWDLCNLLEWNTQLVH